jgi:hypothetical protein
MTTHLIFSYIAALEEGMGEGVLEGQEEGEREEREGVPRKRDLGDLAKVRSSAQRVFRNGLSWKAGSESGSRARIWIQSPNL